MQGIKDYLLSVRFVLRYSFRFVPGSTFVMSVLSVVAGILPYIGAFLLGTLVNAILKGTQVGSYVGILSVLVLYAFVTSMPTIVGNLQLYVNRRRMLTLQMETDLDFLKQRSEIDIASYEDPQFQDLIQRTFRNGANPTFQLGNAQFDIIRALVSFVFGTVLAIHFNFLVYFVVIVTAIPAFLMDVKYAGKSWNIWSKDSPEQRRLADLRTHITFRIPLIETKLLQSGKRLLLLMRKILSDFATVQLSLEKKRLLHASSTDILALIGFTAGLFLVVRSVVSGQFQVGTLVYIMTTLSNVRNSIANLLETISGQYENHLIVRDMITFMNTGPVIIESAKPTVLDLSSVPEITFKNVSFKYSNSEKYSLRNISLTLQSGNKIGLVGNNGAGKTTFVKLLCRIYDPTQGKILINGIDLKDLDFEEWWSYLGVMLQDYNSYDFITKEAIAVGRTTEELDIDKVKQAAEISQSSEFIEEWEKKYDHPIGVEFNGVEPSKGQRQKLAIAKTIYRNPLVMVLDEPTASVDAESEAKIFDSLENLPQSMTAILISHDFSTIKECDHIFVLDKGELAEEGDHTRLMKKNSLYADL